MHGKVDGVNIGDTIEITNGYDKGLIGIVKDIAQIEHGWHPIGGPEIRYVYRCTPKLTFGKHKKADAHIFETYEPDFTKIS